MHRNLIGASSVVAIVALFAGVPVTGVAHEDSNLCNVLLDGDGEPVLESDSDSIGHSNSEACADNVEAAEVEATGDVENTLGDTRSADVEDVATADIEPMVVYFDINEDSLDDAAQAEVEAYVTALMETSPTSLSVVGFTDTSGPADVNAKLSAARAESVSAALVEAGVPADLIDRNSSGEDSLAVETPDGTSEASNRRVTITPSYGS